MLPECLVKMPACGGPRREGFCAATAQRPPLPAEEGALFFGGLFPMRTIPVLALSLLLTCSCAMPASASKDLDALRRFSQVMDLVERHYVTETKREDLINGAIKGMLENLDAHSTYMNAQEYKEMQETTSGEFFGIGIEITMENNTVKVVTPIEDTPAYKAGLKAGDSILAIDGKPAMEISLQEVVSRIRGPKGTEVVLTILHAGAAEPKKVAIVRDAIPLVSVKSRKLEDGYYWIRLTRFSEKTTQDLKDAVRAAQKESKGGIKGLVLDLRNNPGGLLDQAVGVSDVFLNEGKIVSIRGREEDSERVFRATRDSGDLISQPMVALVNAGSASASEIVAGALRDQKRALILGERTFGKGSVQNIIPMADGSALKLTIARYYTPSGVSIQAEGITPDIEVPFEAPARDQEDSPYLTVREKDLDRHLKGDAEKRGTGKEDRKARDGHQEAREQLARDNQLRMALQFVKNMPRLKAILQ